MSTYASLLGARRGPVQLQHASASTPQSEFLAGRAHEQHVNAAGGVVFTLDDMKALRRFLILGTDSGTYYASRDALSQTALELIDRCLTNDPVKTVDTIVEISEAGSPLKQSPCLFALARACSKLTGDPKRDSDNKDCVTRGRAYALAQAPRVLRTFQHVFEFLDYCRRQRGAGSGLLRVLADIITKMPVDKLEYQALKYRQRVGWTPRDLLRYTHPKARGDVARDNLLGWVTQPESSKGRSAVLGSPRLAAFEELQKGALGPNEAAVLIREHKLTHEFVPNELLNHRVVWEALLPNLPLTALVRNLRKMTQVELLVDGSDAVLTLRDRLVNAEALRRARLHPLRLLLAERHYRSGTDRRGTTFIPSSEVLGVLEDALELSWTAVEPLGRHVVVALDCSGSMSWDAAEGLSAFEAGLILALWYKRTERKCTFLTFNTQAQLHTTSNKPTLNELRNITQIYGGTNCAAPFEWLEKNNVDPEVILLITDNETWAGRTHVVESLARLRKKAKHPIAMITAAVTATNSTVGDPTDPHSLEIVGFDPTVPEAIAEHVKEVFC